MSVAGIQSYGLLGVAFYAIVVGIILVLIYEERDPSTTLAWLLVLVLFPGVGLVLYVFFGRNWRLIARTDRKRREALGHGDAVMAPIYARHAAGALEVARRDPPLIGRLVTAIRAQNGTEPLPCVQLEILPTGAQKFDRLFRDIESATDHIHLNYFIWEHDELTARFCDLLAEKVAAGIEVRVMYDWVGSIGYGKRQLAALKRAGATVKADAAKWTKLNYRNHRKIAVVDGKVAYTGGMNVGQEYIDGKPRYESWRDTHVRFGGPRVADLQRLFAERWMRISGESLFAERYFPDLDDTVGGAGVVWAQVVHSGPETRWAAVRQAFLIAIASADTQVRIQSPYFVPDQGIIDALVAQSLAGVDVRFMMTGVPDKRIAWWAAFTYIDDLVEAGGRVFQYRAGFFHPKTMTIDGAIAVIGTTNFDIRSFSLHDELSIVFYDEGVAASQDAIFEDDLSRCAEVTGEDVTMIGRLERMRNALARLSSRVL
jgi:cardiolipin synthase A/B